jgi:mycoredoxin
MRPGRRNRPPAWMVLGGMNDEPPGNDRGMTTTITMYSTPWCGYCRRLKRQFEDEGISYREIDVDATPGYDERILQATGGYRTVPTIEVGGRLLVNPSLREVREALTAA